jgi:hypothetical protein
LCVLSEKKHTIFFDKLGRLAAKAHGSFYTHNKRLWGKEKHVALKFSGRLTTALESSFLAVIVADLAYGYVEGLNKRQDRLAGFVEGISLKTDNNSLNAMKEAEEAVRKWVRVKKTAVRPVKRNGGAFEEARAVGEESERRLKKIKTLKNA